MWAIGVILYIMCTGFPPFDGKEPKDITKKIQIGKYDSASK